MNPDAKKPGPAAEARKKTAPLPNFDTLGAVRKLKNAEFGDKQAVTLVETIQETQNELATRADVERTELALRSDMERTELALRGDLERTELALRSDMEKMETSIRGDMKEMGASIRGEIQELRGEMNGRFATLYWRLLLGASVMTGILGTLITLTGAR